VNVTCLECGWVHFAVTRESAERAVADFNAYYDAWPKETQEMYGGPADIKNYLSCWCGSQSFRKAEAGDCPDGVTIGPVIWEESP
jgi:hypothetical protein